jgi:hypothetical protein
VGYLRGGRGTVLVAGALVASVKLKSAAKQKPPGWAAEGHGDFPRGWTLTVLPWTRA